MTIILIYDALNLFCLNADKLVRIIILSYINCLLQCTIIGTICCLYQFTQDYVSFKDAVTADPSNMFEMCLMISVRTERTYLSRVWHISSSAVGKKVNELHCSDV